MIARMIAITLRHHRVKVMSSYRFSIIMLNVMWHYMRLGHDDQHMVSQTTQTPFDIGLDITTPKLMSRRW